LSLLGRLEDLSLTDIIQIVYLSRRSGVLEIINTLGRNTVLFRHGLVVNACSPDSPYLLGWLVKNGVVSADEEETLRSRVAEGVPAGTAAIEEGILTSEKLRELIHDRIIDTIGPLLQSRAGEFNFLLSDELGPIDVEYDADAVLREGGFTPQSVLAFEGERLKPLQELSLPPEGETPIHRTKGTQFRVSDGLMEMESTESKYRNVVVFDRDPLIRVAVKRIFGSRQMRIAQFGTMESTREAITEYFRSTSFFITFLEVTDDSVPLLQLVKRKNPRLPVVMVDAETDLRRRYDLLHSGADLYLTKPTAARLRPDVAEDELNLFAEELALFAERAFAQWEDNVGLDSLAARRFYEEGQREHIERGFKLLKQLINEISDPNDIREVASTILRLSAQYLDRGVLFVVNDEEFTGVGGFGVTGDGEAMDSRAQKLHVPRGVPSILSDVIGSNEMRRGKLRRTRANQDLVGNLGGPAPTEVVALPIMHGERTIGILYGDNAEHRAPIDDMTGLEIFLSQAGYAFGSAVAAER
jgi:CheY-like chemotaxis protein